jgi:hypothetical protein
MGLPAASCSTMQVLSALRKEKDLAFKEALSLEVIGELLEKYKVDFRDRDFPPDLTLMAFVTQLIRPKSSCQDAVNMVNRERNARGLPPVSSSTSAYCKARKRIPLELIKDLALRLGHAMESCAPESWSWLGHQVKLIDGTTFTMADTPSNQEAWPQPKQQQDGVGFPMMRAVGILGQATGGCLGLAYGPVQGKETGEHALFRQLLKFINKGDVVVADRYYCSYFLIAQLVAQGAHIITRIHGSRDYDFRRGKRLGTGDHIVELVKPPKPNWMDQEQYEKIPDTLELREMKGEFGDRNGEEVVIVTTLLDPKKYPRTEVLSAYKLRWNVELDLRSLKTVMGMDFLACKSPEMIDREVWTYILSYNLVRKLVCQAAVRHDVDPRRISFSGAISVFNGYMPLVVNAATPEIATRMFDCMIDQIAEQVIPYRPGRKEPRAVKRRPKDYPRLTKTRKIARETS